MLDRTTCASPTGLRIPQIRNRHFLALDALLLTLTPLLALTLRVEKESQVLSYLTALSVYTVCALAIRLVIFYPFGLYNRFWQYATVDELAQTTLAVTVSTIVVALPFYFLPVDPSGAFYLPRSLPIVESLLVLLAIGSTRFSVRLIHRRPGHTLRKDASRVLVVGAGASGQSIVRELRSHPQLGLRPVGFLDDDPNKKNLHILSIPVLGNVSRLPEIVSERRIDQVIIAMPSAPGKMIRECMSLCEQVDVPAKTIPPMSALLDGRHTISHLRNVEIEDLLRREPIETDVETVRELIQGRRVLVTGGGGSIGSEICRQVLRWTPSALAIVGHGENSVFEIYNELKASQANRHAACQNGNGHEERNGSEDAVQTELQACIADIRSARRMHNIVKNFQPDIIFHAAAHKHVPLMESNPGEAASNNILGTQNLLQVALDNDVEHFVMISTDKAVNPTSIMGTTKRVAEMLVMRAARISGKPYVAVRFGNVLGSRGSVVPIFKRQIAAGGPVTVTHQDMTRYFMTIPESVQLVLQAAVLGKGGEVFMLNMGQPVRIVDLARDLIELSGLTVGRDIDIVFTGIRPGEKLHEELLLDGECYQSTPHPKLRIALNTAGATPPILSAVLDELTAAVHCDDQARVVSCLRALVPEFEPDAAHALPPHSAIVKQRPRLVREAVYPKMPKEITGQWVGQIQ